jgi:hypothetical protein
MHMGVIGIVEEHPAGDQISLLRDSVPRKTDQGNRRAQNGAAVQEIATVDRDRRTWSLPCGNAAAVATMDAAGNARDHVLPIITDLS